MQLQLFVLCDNAQVYSGKAVVVGVFNRINAKSLPVTIPQMSLAIRAEYEASEIGQKHFIISLVKPNGSLLLPSFETDISIQTPSDSEPFTTVDFNISYNNIVFDEYGIYKFVLKEAENYFYYRFIVKQI